MAITGDLTITTEDGTILSASTDLGLAWKWAEHENGETWAGMPTSDRNASVAEALAELRRAAANGGE